MSIEGKIWIDLQPPGMLYRHQYTAPDWGGSDERYGEIQARSFDESIQKLCNFYSCRVQSLAWL